METAVDVVVVAFGAPDLLEVCLDTLGDAYPLLVVDNSSDAKVRAVAARHGARYVDPGANLGFAGGVNVGLAERGRPTADVLLLNPDASITAEGVADLSRFLHASRRSGLRCPRTGRRRGPAGPGGLAVSLAARCLGGGGGPRSPAPP